jgi:mono/diheme cytochrome c family protein
MMNKEHTSRTFGATTLAAFALIAGTAAIGGCQGDRSSEPPRQFFPDMDDSPKHKPQVQTDFFVDKRAMRPPVAHTVAFGRHNANREILVGKPDWFAPFHGQRQDLLKDEWELYKGAVPKVKASGEIETDMTGRVFEKVVDTIPIRVDADLIRRGEERFNIYCAICHGYEGDGKGLVGDASLPTGWVGGARNLLEPAYKDKASLKGKDGYLYYVARDGYYDAATAQKMPGYAHALSMRDSWAVVAWIRVLQEARSVPMNEIPAEERDRLNASKPAPAPAPTPTPAPAGTPAATPANGGKP